MLGPDNTRTRCTRACRRMGHSVGRIFGVVGETRTPGIDRIFQNQFCFFVNLFLVLEAGIPGGHRM